MIKFIEAVLIFSGMIIGVGMFAIPFSFVQSGFLLGMIELAILTGVVMLLHILYGELVVEIPQFHRMPGYMLSYLGKRASYLAWFSAIFGIVGALLAYTVVDGLFLHNTFRALLPGIGEFHWALFSVAAGAVLTSFSLKKEALIGGFLAILEIGIIVFLSVSLLPYFEVMNLGGGFHAENILVPYGVLLFSLSGGVIIPDIVEILGRRRKTVRLAILVGTFIPALLYAFFAFAVVGAAGGAVSEEALRSLIPIVGEKIVIIGSIAGFLAVFTSFIALNLSFQALLRLDFGLGKILSWFIASSAPLFLYLLGFHAFISIIAILGAIGIGVDSTLILLSYRRLEKLRGVPPSFFSYAWKCALFVLIVSGIFYESIKLLS